MRDDLRRRSIGFLLTVFNFPNMCGSAEMEEGVDLWVLILLLEEGLRKLGALHASPSCCTTPTLVPAAWLRMASPFGVDRLIKVVEEFNIDCE